MVKAQVNKKGVVSVFSKRNKAKGLNMQLAIETKITRKQIHRIAYWVICKLFVIVCWFSFHWVLNPDQAQLLWGLVWVQTVCKVLSADDWKIKKCFTTEQYFYIVHIEIAKNFTDPAVCSIFIYWSVLWLPNFCSNILSMHWINPFTAA